MHRLVGERGDGAAVDVTRVRVGVGQCDGLDPEGMSIVGGGLRDGGQPVTVGRAGGQHHDSCRTAAGPESFEQRRHVVGAAVGVVHDHEQPGDHGREPVHAVVAFREHPGVPALSSQLVGEFQREPGFA